MRVHLELTRRMSPPDKRAQEATSILHIGSDTRDVCDLQAYKKVRVRKATKIMNKKRSQFMSSSLA